MNKSILLIALILAPLSGCLGIPEGAISPGDSVQATVTVRDADTGELLLANQALDFVVGQGVSGMGFEFERQLVAQPNNFDGTVIIRNDPSLQWRSTVDVQARYESPLVNSIPIEQFTATFGQPSVDQIFSPRGYTFDYQVVSVEADAVSFKPIPEEGHQDPTPHLGAILHSFAEGDQFVQVLHPDVGATFRILPPSPFNPNPPLGLAPGSYRTVSGDGEFITYEYSPATNPDLVGHNLDIEVRVRNVAPAPAGTGVQPVDGNYGVRQSPYVNGAPSPIVNFGPLSGAAHADHDHGHDH